MDNEYGMNFNEDQKAHLRSTGVNNNDRQSTVNFELIFIKIKLQYKS